MEEITSQAETIILREPHFVIIAKSVDIGKANVPREEEAETKGQRIGPEGEIEIYQDLRVTLDHSVAAMIHQASNREVNFRLVKLNTDVLIAG